MKKKIVSIILCLTFIFAFETNIIGENTAVQADKKEDLQLPSQTDSVNYSDYLKNFDENNSTVSFKLDINSVEIAGGEKTSDGINLGIDGSASFTFEAPESGFYNLELDYMLEPGRVMDTEISVEINGAVPFKESTTIALKRIWKDNTDTFLEDSFGNDINPRTEENAVWSAKRVSDPMGYVLEPLKYYLKKGENEISIVNKRDAVNIRRVTFASPIDLPVYSDYISALGGIENKGENYIKLQAEHAFYVNDPTLTPVFDASSSKTEPYKKGKLSLNYIGSERWRDVGQEITWKFDASESGFYKINIKARQDYKRMYSSRALRINGEIPFEEAESIMFGYGNDWANNVLGDKNGDFLFYFEKGENIISLEVNLGDLGEILGRLADISTRLNAVYRHILMITSMNPDTLRDYKLEKQIPDDFVEMGKISAELKEIIDIIEASSGTKGQETTTLSKMILQLDNFIEKPYEIPKKFNDFSSNISALEYWRFEIVESPLDIDFIEIYSKDYTPEKANESFFEAIAHGVYSFFVSFTNEYDSLGSRGNNDAEVVKVWVPAGRDQVSVLNEMAAMEFDESSDIRINFELVSGDAIIPSIVAGNGADVIMFNGYNMPVNLATRKAAVDLSKLEGFDEVAGRFRDASLVSAEYDGGVYGLPDVETFSMMFYRNDILSELGIEVPQTWDDVINLIPALQKYNMNFLMDAGLSRGTYDAFSGGSSDSAGLTSYLTFLLQNGGQLYSDDLTKAMLDSETSIKAFKDFTSFYTEYGLLTNFNALTRFRMGDSPIIVTDRGLYSLLMASAEEISGLWSAAEVPGTLQPDGSIDRSVRSFNSYSIIPTTAKNIDGAWKFLKWWSSAEAQIDFSRGIVNKLGLSSGYFSANLEAQEQSYFPLKDMEIIEKQAEHIVGIPEVPGGYYVSRHFTNALRGVLIKKEDPREMMIYYNQSINSEIREKRIEFGLPVAEQ